MARQVFVPNTVLSLTSTGISTADGTAAVTSKVMYLTVADGEVLALPKLLRPRMKLYDNTTPDEMPRDTVWGFGLITTMDPNRIIPIGPQMIPYTNFLDLTLANQGHADYVAQTTFDITRQAPVIVFNQDETFCFLVYSATGTLDISECTIEIPVYKARAGDISRELAWRYAEIGR